jgi:hypothetical protein
MAEGRPIKIVIGNNLHLAQTNNTVQMSILPQTTWCSQERPRLSSSMPKISTNTLRVGDHGACALLVRKK